MTKTFPIVTTLNNLARWDPCSDGAERLLRYLGKDGPDDEPLPLATILDSNGLMHAIWCCRALPEYDREWRLFAVWCGRQVQHLTTDTRTIAALDVAEKYANGDATYAELEAAHAAVHAATAAHAATYTAAHLAAHAAAANYSYAQAINYTYFYNNFVAVVEQVAAFRQLITTGTLP